MKIIRPLLFICVTIIVLQACKEKAPIKADPAFAEYISAYTTGTISAASDIRIRLSNTPELSDEQDLSDNSIFRTEPSINGTLEWEDSQTLVFRPEKDLPHNQLYTAHLRLGEIINTSAELSEFAFSFKTLEQHAEVQVEGLRNYRIEDMENMYLNGMILTWDVVQNEKLEHSLSASQNGKSLPITWSHDIERTRHSFVVDSILRTEEAGEVSLDWSGKEIGAEKNEQLSQEIPSLGDFKVLNTTIIQHPEQYVKVHFSDPLKRDFDLEGLVSIASNSIRTISDGNTLSIYPENRLSGEYELHLSGGIQNLLGFKLEEDFSMPITFEELKPAVRFVNDNKTILPRTDGLIYPFEAVSLKAVDVAIIKVYESNVPQFLQINDLNGDRELKRSGRLLKRKTIALDDSETNLSQWNRYYLDLDEFITPDPGAIYRIEIGFRQQYAVYDCMESVGDGEMEELNDNWDEASADNSYWDYFDSYYYDYYWGDYYGSYDYRERDNPCNKAYYMSRRPVKANVLSSDLGLIVKSGNNGEVLVVLSDLKSTRPISGADVQLRDFQQQVIASSRTDAQGMARFEATDRSPFLAEVDHQGQKAYLKLHSGHSLSTSKFDVSGSNIEKGLKGFIYGERGVWRPGDSLYLGFILDDSAQPLPQNHPIKMELHDARGRSVMRKVYSRGKEEIFPFHVATSADAATGNWLFKVMVGGASFSKNLPVESIKPNRLKINFDFNKEMLSSNDESLKGKLMVHWLHGAKAGGLQAVVNSTFRPAPTRFDTHRDFNFEDPTRQFRAREQQIFDGSVDKKGEANIELDVQLGNPPPGMLTANFNTKVFERGGEFSIDQFSIPYSPYSHYVGIKLPKGDKARGMLLTDEKHEVQVVSKDQEGRAAANRKLEYEFFKIHWRWWWEHYDDNLSQYAGEMGNTPISNGNITTNKKGEASFQIEANYPDWGRYLVRVTDQESGHSSASIVYLDWPGWAGRAERENPGGASMLVVSTDKESYSPGENCVLSFPSSGLGRALLSIESGSEILETRWIEPKKEQTSIEISITEEMAPNVYAHISILQPHAQTANDLPIRMYGIVPIMVQNPNTHLQPSISMPDELAPESEYEVTVSEKSGKAMYYTLAVVDEGLLDLTRFKTPKPWEHFYSREALGVRTWDVYDDVIGAFGAGLQHLLAVGGGGSLKSGAKNKVNRFEPVVEYLGPFLLEAGKKQKHRLEMPNYIGSVRTMLIATKGKAHGSAEKTTPVKKPLMVLSTLPRVLSPRESVKLPVTIFAMEDNIREVNVKVTVEGPLKIKGDPQQRIQFRSSGEQMAYFDLDILSKEGFARVEVQVSSGAEKAYHQTELEVVNPNPYETRMTEKVVAEGGEYEFNTMAFGMAGTRNTYLEVSGIPDIHFGSRLKYLLSYPHGCVEQTTSRAFPQLFLSDVMELSPEEKERAQQNVKAAILKLQSFQNASGGLSYWRGGQQVSDWGSSYAGHFILEAEKKAYPVDRNFKKAWLRYQRQASRDWRPANQSHRNWDLEQAYRLYTLALAGQPEIGAMNRFREHCRTTVARWMLAAAYAISGKEKTANRLVKDLGTEIEEYKELSGTFGSSLRDQSLIVETLLLLNRKEEAATVVYRLAEQLGDGYRWSTQSTAFGLLAVSRYAADQFDDEMKFSISGTEIARKTYTSSKPIVQIPLDSSNEDLSLKFMNQSGSTLYARLVQYGQPIMGQEKDENKDLRLDLEYLDMNGNRIDVSELTSGTDFVAHATVYYTGYLNRVENIALTQVFPGGWEIINTRLSGNSDLYPNSPHDYLDIRDDRVNTYFDLRKGEKKSFYVLLNASYQGTYHLPSTNAEAMYDSGIYARKSGRIVQVTGPNSSLANNKP